MQMRPPRRNRASDGPFATNRAARNTADPQVLSPGPNNLITDVAGLKVGNAEDHRWKTGGTVLMAERPFTASVHVMGGAPGTRETDLLAPDKSVEQVDALVLGGGSAFGLAACDGVMEGLHAQGRGFEFYDARIPIVPGAIVFDLLNGGEKEMTALPYKSLGRQAASTASEAFNLGTAGAGTGALCSNHKGGLGSASLVLTGGATVGALVVANPLGSPVTPGGRHFWAAPFEIEAEFGGLGVDGATTQTGPYTSLKQAAFQERANTTIAIVATDARLTKPGCARLATAAHDGIARAVVPAHSPGDGDLVFGVSYGNQEADMVEICSAAAHCLSRAIARAVWEATPATNALMPTFRESLRRA